MSNSKKLFVIGFMVFVSIIIFIGGILFLQDISFKNSNYSFYVIFQEIPGLYKGDDVKMLGEKIGKIADTKIIYNNGNDEDSKATVQVELSIYNKFVDKIPVESKIEVKSEGFLGTKYIAISPPGSHNNKFILVGETVYGIGDYDFSEMTTDIGPITQDIARFMNRLNSLFRDEEYDKIREIISNVESLTNSIDEFSNSNKNIISDVEKQKIKNIISDLAEMSETLRIKLNSDITNIIDNTNSLSNSFPDLKSTIKNLTQITESMKESSEGLNNMILSIEQKDNTLGKLIYEDSLYFNINGVALDLRGLIQDIKENPTKYMKAYFQGKK